MQFQKVYIFIIHSIEQVSKYIVKSIYGNDSGIVGALQLAKLATK